MWLLFACTPSPEPSDQPTGPDSGGATADTAAAETLTVLGLNLHCLKLEGTPFADQEARFAAIAQEVDARGVDAVAAQEVCVGAQDARTLFLDALAAATGAPWEVAWAYAHVGWAGTEDEADEGVAVFAREPLRGSREVAYVAPGVLRRVALSATLADGTELVSVHLDYDDEGAREDQARQTAVAPLVATLDAVVAGDLNARAGSATHGAFGLQGWVDATADLDADRIDHTFVHRGATWAPAGAELVLPDVSDHPGVLTTFTRRASPALAVTRFVATVDVGFGNAVSLRGDTPPLSWDRGWWAVPVDAARWELVSTELTGPLAFKVLRNDADWELGDDHVGNAGEEHVFTPTFP
jgi:endonuclease/exonuclease/phosphatase family metal-dependent hydrolase